MYTTFLRQEKLTLIQFWATRNCMDFIIKTGKIDKA